MIYDTHADGFNVIIDIGNGEILRLMIPEAVKLAGELPEAIRSASEFEYYGKALADIKELDQK